MFRIFAQKTFSPRDLSYILGFIGLLFASIIYYPMSLVFKGEWKVNQQFELFTLEMVNLFGIDIPIGTISVRFYSICLVLGMLAGYSLSLFLSKKHFIVSTIVDRLFIGLVIWGLVGARLFFAAFNWELFSANPLGIFTEVANGGLAIFGAILVCTFYVWAYCQRFKFNFFEFGDFITPGLLLGQVLGRFGNFFNYEAYGGPTSLYWKMYVPQIANIYEDLNAKFFHPTFLYEIIPNFLLLLVILFFYEPLTKKRSGLVLAFYAIGYGSVRFLTEFFRLDALKILLENPINFLGVKIDSILPSQLSALLLIVVGLVIYFKRRKIIFSKRNMSEVSV